MLGWGASWRRKRKSWSPACQSQTQMGDFTLESWEQVSTMSSVLILFLFSFLKTLAWSAHGSTDYLYCIKRRESLEVILPRTQLFQERMDSLHQWLISVEQDLAELRSAERAMLHLQEATEQAKVTRRQIHVICSIYILLSQYFSSSCWFPGCRGGDKSKKCGLGETSAVQSWSHGESLRLSSLLHKKTVTRLMWKC